MNMFRDKRFIVPSIVSLTMIFIFIFLGFNNNIIFNLLKGDSVTSNVYYYCKDPSYTLEGNKCTNIIYADNTKRANELGVMTKDAYESATLYFQ